MKRLVPAVAVLPLALACLARAAAPEEQDKPVPLPPYFVRENLGGRPWQHGSIPGFEVLSHCSDSVTRIFIRAFVAQHRLFHEMVPADLEYRSSVPTTLILFDQPLEKTITPEMVAVMEESGSATADGIPQMRLQDIDSMGMVFVLDDRKGGDYRSFYLSPDYMADLLTKRAPPLPQWFMTGVSVLYREATYSETSLKLNSAHWSSPETTHAIEEDPGFPSRMLPMAEFLNSPAPPDGSEGVERSRIWTAQAALFVRWALDGAGHPHRDAFWKFVARACAEPATESMFREHFGMGFTEFGQALGAYLAASVKPASAVVLTAEEPDESEGLLLHPATRTEMARIQGDWERKEIALVKKRFPRDLPLYVAQGAGILSDGISENPGDVGLEASAGIFFCEDASAVGDNIARGRALLESAVRANVTRPAAYAELGRQRLSEALAAPAGANRKLSAAQVASVTSLVRDARSRGLFPQEAYSYALAAEALAAAAEPPSADDLALIKDGVRLFPRDVFLARAAAALIARAAHSTAR